MIEAAGRRRLAGDWRSACAAAAVDVQLDPRLIRREHGDEVARMLLDDLRQLAPDLVRWHLPRDAHGCSLLRPGLLVPLARYPGELNLVVLSTAESLAAGQRLILTTLGLQQSRHTDPAVPPGVRAWRAERHQLREQRMFWDARQAPRLRELCPAGAAAAAVTACQDAGRDGSSWTRAWALAGIRIRGPAATRAWSSLPANLPVLLDQARLARPGADRVAIRPGGGIAVLLSGLTRADVVAELVPAAAAGAVPVLSSAAWARPVDADLLRLGLLGPGDLHPLVAAALCPGRRLGGRRRPTVEAVADDSATLVRERFFRQLTGWQAFDDLEPLLEHGRTSEVLAGLERRLGAAVDPGDVRLGDGTALSELLRRQRRAAIRHQSRLAGLAPPRRRRPAVPAVGRGAAPGPVPPAAPGRGGDRHLRLGQRRRTRHRAGRGDRDHPGRGLSGNRLSVYSCDAAVHTAEQICRAEQVTLVGGGGTDLRQGIRRALTDGGRPDVVVVLTDGLTPWPAEPPADWVDSVRLT